MHFFNAAEITLIEQLKYNATSYLKMIKVVFRRVLNEITEQNRRDRVRMFQKNLLALKTSCNW